MGELTSKIVPFAPWEPDQPAFMGSHAVEARNVIPVKRGYRPLSALQTTFDVPVPGSVNAAYTFSDMSGNIYTLMSTTDGVFSLEGRGWVGKNAQQGALPGCAFIHYGNTVFMAKGGIALQKSTVVNGILEKFTVVENAPQATCLGVFRDFLVAGEHDDIRGSLRWSGLDDPESWPVVGSTEAQHAQSDRQIFPVGGKVQALVGGVGGDGLVFLESAIHRATYVGPPYVFQFDVVDRHRGLLAPFSPIVCENTCVYLAADGWFMTDGAQVKGIGAERINEWFFREVDVNRLSEVHGVRDEAHRVALWSFAGLHCPPGRHNRLLIYNYALDAWSYGAVESQRVFSDYSRPLSLEDLDGIYPSLEDIPFSLDTSSLQGRVPGVSLITSQSTIGSLVGFSLEAVMDTAEIGGERLCVHGLRPLVDEAPSASASLAWRDRQGDRPLYEPFAEQNADGICAAHVSCRFVRGRVRVPAGVAWTHALGCAFQMEQEGG